ncbi:MAG: carboxypeptidase-like regulatory domain-containing protein [Anaerolineae bacterium]
MKQMKRLWIVVLSIMLALLASAPGTAYAQRAAKFAAHSEPAATVHSALTSSTLEAPVAQTSRCTAMEAGDVVWVTLNEEGEVEEEVESYPSGTTGITAQFEYNCVPRKTTLVTVWYLDGEAVLTSEDKPKATNQPDTWQAYLYMKDESPLPDGEYGVEFYVGDELLTQGMVTIGGDGLTVNAVTVQGTIVDSRSKKPIKGALVVVLNEGVVAEDWLQDGTDEDIFASAKTDSKGQFVLDSPIEIGVPHSWLIGAQGYRVIIQEDWALEEDTEDPLVLNIKLVKKK